MFYSSDNIGSLTANTQKHNQKLFLGRGKTNLAVRLRQRSLVLFPFEEEKMECEKVPFGLLV